MASIRSSNGNERIQEPSRRLPAETTTLAESGNMLHEMVVDFTEIISQEISNREDTHPTQPCIICRITICIVYEIVIVYTL